MQKTEYIFTRKLNVESTVGKLHDINMISNEILRMLKVNQAENYPCK